MTERPARSPRSHRTRPDAAPQDDSRLAAETLQRSCARVTGNLRDTMGADGCAALLARALTRTEAEHPALLTLRRQDGREIHLDGVAEAMQQHGRAAVEAGVQALMRALVEVLGRLIGEDMAVRIIDLGAAPDERRQGRA